MSAKKSQKKKEKNYRCDVRSGKDAEMNWYKFYRREGEMKKFLHSLESGRRGVAIRRYLRAMDAAGDNLFADWHRARMARPRISPNSGARKSLPRNLYVGRKRVEEHPVKFYAEAENASTKAKGWKYSGAELFISQLAVPPRDGSGDWICYIYVLPWEGKE